MSGATLRMAVVGTGHMAQTMIAAIRHVDGVTVTGVVSRDSARAQAIAAACGVGGSYGDLTAALADPAVDAVYVANDSAAHAATSVAALRAGKAVLCEKPFAIAPAEAEAVAEAARASGRLLMEAVATPFLPAVRRALDAARGGELGTLRQLAADFGYPASPQTHPGCWRPDGGGVLLDRMVYPVTLARLALGPVESVQARIIRDATGIDVDATLMLAHAGGATALLGASLIAALGNAMTIAGEAGTASVAAPLLLAEGVAIRASDTPTRPAPGDGWKRRLAGRPVLRRLRSGAQALGGHYMSYGASSYVPELEHFRDLHRQGLGESPVLPLAVSIDVARILAAARNRNDA